MDISIYKGKKIMILGLGREGIDSLLFFLKKCPKNEIAAADKSQISCLDPAVKEILLKNSQVRIFLGSDYLSALDSYDIIVKSPGIPIHIREVEQAYKQNKIVSQASIFFDQCPSPIIGITGTKGKSTTSSIIYEILRSSGRKVFLLGNIGTPMLSYLDAADKESIFVCELSAHQLYNLKKSPHISILLNIYPEHLDYYSDYNEYIRAKANIAVHQSKNDYFIFNSAISEVANISLVSMAKKIAFNEYKWNWNGKTNLIGGFNLENAKIGAIVGRLFGISDKIINKAIVEFKPLDNRLEFAGSFNGIDFYNDSLSTIQESAVAAIGGLGDRVYTLICGGFDRGQPFDKLAAAILDSNIGVLILFPTTGIKIWEELQKQVKFTEKNERFGAIAPFFVQTMDEAVNLALSKTKQGKICLLSAASASFNIFRDYADRGNCFKKCLVMQTAKSGKLKNNG